MERLDRNVAFSFDEIQTKQFALLDIEDRSDENINLETQFRFGHNFENNQLIVLFKVVFSSDKKPLIVLETACYFTIAKESWKAFYKKDRHTLVIPVIVITHLAVLTVGTARGILHAKTENTAYNKYMLPTINLEKIFTGDLVLNLEETVA